MLATPQGVISLPLVLISLVGLDVLLEYTYKILRLLNMIPLNPEFYGYQVYHNECATQEYVHV